MSSNVEITRKNDDKNIRPRKRNRPRRNNRQLAGWPLTKTVSSNQDKVIESRTAETAPTPGYISTFKPVTSNDNKSEMKPRPSKAVLKKSVPANQVPAKQVPAKQVPAKQVPAKQVPAKPAKTLAKNVKPLPSIHNKTVKLSKYVDTQNSAQVFNVVHTSEPNKCTPVAPLKTALRLLTPVELMGDNSIYVPDPEDPKLSRGFTEYMDKMKVWPWQNNVKELVTISGIEDDAARTKSNYKFLKSTFHRNDSRSHWYKITIVGYSAKSTMETVLDSIIQYVYPERFIPCFVQKECRFLVTNCSQALLNICYQGLSFTSEIGTKLYITISLSSESPDFDVILAKHKRIRDRFNKATGFMDLSNYKVVTYRGKVIMYFPLTHAANQKLIASKLDYFQHYPVTHLKLSNNKLRNIKDFNIHINYPRLKTLDLSNNSLSSTTALSCLKGMCLRNVILEGNPLCLDFVTQESYISILKYVFPKLQTVDGVTVVKKGFPVSQCNYLVEQDAHTLVDTFLQTYFKLFDSEERRKSGAIANLYHKNAIFTLCSSALIVNLCGKIGMIIRHSKIVRERPRVSGIFCGIDEIVRFLNRCPETQHDPQSFKVDVTVHTDKITVVTVSGIFKSPTPGLLEDEPLIYFTRTFVLKSVSRYEYKIANDMLYMTKADEDSTAAAYSITSPQCALSLDFTTTIPDPDLKNQLGEVFMKLTSLSKPQALRCLEVRNWNFRLGLEYFLLLDKRNEIHVLGAN